MKKIPCSAAILTLNSAKTLGRCLESVKDFAEIVVLDGNSTDGTQEIARGYGAKVYPQKDTEEKNIKIDNFAAIRIKLVSMTTAPWYFELDSDEYISQELHDEIAEIVSDLNADPKIVYSLPRKAIINGKVIEHANFYPDYFVRLYKKESGVVYKPEKKVHEQLFIPPDAVVRKTIGCIYAPWLSYNEQIKRDDYYLSLELKKARLKMDGRNTLRLKARALRSAFMNLLKAGKFLAKALVIYLRYGFKDTPPIKYSWRFIRYHLLVSGLRLKLLFYLKTAQ